MNTNNIHITKTYHYFYKITNKINGMFYYGIHSTNDLDDGYMGSGKRLHYAYKKYGKENFVKEIIKFFDTFEELSNYEALIVNEELLNDPNCYNLIKGGYNIDEKSLMQLKKTLKERNHQQGNKNSCYGTCWITKDNNSIKIKKTELDNYISLGWVKGRKLKDTTKIVKANSNRIWLYKDDKTTFVNKDIANQYILDGWNIGRKPTNKKKRLSTEEYVEYRKQSYENFKNSIRVRDKDGNEFVVKKDDPKYLSGELVYYAKGKILVKDNNNNKIYVDVNDPRYLSGELLPVWSSKNRVTVKDINGNYLSVYKDDEGLKTGKYVGCTKGVKCTDEQKENIRKAKTKEKMTWINDGKIHKYIPVRILKDFLKDNPNWKAGRIKGIPRKK